MPKLKRASSAHVASQARRRKKNQRELQCEGDLPEDLPRRQQQRRRERDAEARGPTPSNLRTRFQITVISDLISDF